MTSKPKRKELSLLFFFLNTQPQKRKKKRDIPAAAWKREGNYC
jgi:hypothetical protein